jgi:hypothetical protein
MEKKTGQSNDGTSYNYTNCTLECINHTWSQRFDSSGFLMYSHVSPPSCLLALSENKLTQNLMSSCSPSKNNFGRYTLCSFRQTQIGDSWDSWLILVIHPITSPLISHYEKHNFSWWNHHFPRPAFPNVAATAGWIEGHLWLPILLARLQLPGSRIGISYVLELLFHNCCGKPMKTQFVGWVFTIKKNVLPG